MSCRSVGAVSPGQRYGDVFSFAPAVVANNRIDDIDDPGGVLPLGARDQFLIALASGNPNDDAIDGGDETNDFHASVYLIVDDHREDPEAGFDVPQGAPVTAPGAHSHFMRLPLSQIERTRHIEFADGSSEDQTRVFSKRARPIRAPKIHVTGAADGAEQVDAEVYYVTYTVYEPGDTLCDPRWYDEDSGEWVFDSGTTYAITLRLAIGGDGEFDFRTNYSLPRDPNDGFGVAGALSAARVEQIDACADGNCGLILEPHQTRPCDPNADAPSISGAISIPISYTEVHGFNPLELPL